MVPIAWFDDDLNGGVGRGELEEVVGGGGW